MSARMIQSSASSQELNPAIVNIAGYKFVALDRLAERRRELRERAGSLGLKGTILLSPEGINLFLAGAKPEIDEFLAALRMDKAFQDLEIKSSPGDRRPFRRLLVRLKKEIIPLGRPEIDPGRYTSRKLAPAALRAWLDAGRPLVLLDVRNDYEIGVGTFRNAVPMGLRHFRDFPAAVEKLPDAMREQAVVIFCTGGIRCEKAGPCMEQAGFRNIWQLDGGILKYFEECGSAHFEGDCFVFDHRVAVQPDLEEGKSGLCFACQQVLDRQALESDAYRSGQGCPFCVEPPELKWKRTIAGRDEAIRNVCQPLPGSQPYDNLRPMNVPAACEGATLAEFLAIRYGHLEESVRMEMISTGRIRRDEMLLAAHDIVRAGQRLEHWIPAATEPDVAADIRIVYEDHAVVVVDKPAPLPMHPSGRFNRNTLVSILNRVYESPLRPVHRLDANTCGLVLLARSARWARDLHSQFRNREIAKRYLVKVRGTLPAPEFRVDLPIGDRPVQAGGRITDPDGKECRTDFRCLRTVPDGILLQANPVTGRTNQIRVHLWSLGASVAGDPMYLPGGMLGQEQTLAVDAPPMCLQAQFIGFRHPESGTTMTFQAPLPDWAH